MKKYSIKNKKAFEILGENVVNLVIAVLAIMVLIYLGVKLYGTFSEKNEIEVAQNRVNTFAVEYNEFIKSNEINYTFIIFGPRNWWITSYPKLNEFTPEACKDYNYCLCICKYQCKDKMTACASIESKYDISEDKGYIMKEIPYTLSLVKNETKK